MAALGAAGDAPGRSARRPARAAQHRLLPVRRRPPRSTDSLIPDCAGWPDASAATAAPGAAAERADADPLRRAGPAHPDLGRRSVAALIPDAQLLVVPYTGHSVLGSDFSGCAEPAVKAFFAGERHVQPCATAPNLFAPTPITPTKLAYVHPPSRARRQARADARRRCSTRSSTSNRQVIGATLQADAGAAQRVELRRPARRLRAG